MLKLAPGGVFYFDCKFDFDEEEGDAILKGLVPRDDEAISPQDTRLGVQNKSDILGVSMKKQFKDGTIYTGSPLSKLPMTTLQEYATKAASIALGEICEGYIQPKPDEDACSRCEYRGICLYDSESGVRKKTKTIVDDIAKSLKGGEDNE